jgi:hypothetical protein
MRKRRTVEGGAKYRVTARANNQRLLIEHNPVKQMFLEVLARRSWRPRGADHDFGGIINGTLGKEVAKRPESRVRILVPTACAWAPMKKSGSPVVLVPPRAR